MNLLLDTHILLWHLSDNPKLSLETSALIENEAHQKFLSAIGCADDRRRIIVKSNDALRTSAHPISASYRVCCLGVTTSQALLGITSSGACKAGIPKQSLGTRHEKIIYELDIVSSK